MADVPERVELVRSGGFANITVRASVAATELDPEEQAGVDALLALPAAGGDAAPGAPDRRQYDLSIIVGGRTHHVCLGEHELDDRLRPLVRRLERAATP